MKKLFSLVLAAALLFSCIPVQAFAEETTEQAPLEWLDLVYAYPHYLTNNDAKVQEQVVLYLCQSVYDDYDSWDMLLSELETTLANAGSIKSLLTSFTDALGWTDCLHDEAADAAIQKIMKQLCVNPKSEFGVKAFSSTGKSLKALSKTLDAINRAYKTFDPFENGDAYEIWEEQLQYLCDEVMGIPFSEELYPEALYIRMLREEQLGQITDDFMEYSSNLLKNASDVMKLAQTFSMIIYLQNLQAEMIEYMYTLPLEKDLKDALRRLEADMKTNGATLFYEEYIQNKVIDAIYNQIESSLFGETPDPTKLVTIVLQFTQWLLFDMVYEHPDAEDVLIFLYTCSFAYTTKLTLDQKIGDITTKPVTNAMIEDFSYFYPIYSGSMKAALTSCKTMTTDREMLNQINTALTLFDSSVTRNVFTLEGYQLFCLEKLNGTPEEDRIERKIDYSQQYKLDTRDLVISETKPTNPHCVWVYPALGKLYYGITQEGRMLDDVGSVIFAKPIKYKQITIRGNHNMTAGNFTVPSGMDVVIDGSCSIGQYVYADNWSKMVVEKGASLTVNKNMSIGGSSGNQKTATLQINGEMKTKGNFTAKSYADVKVSGKMELNGDVSFTNAPSGTGTVILAGTTSQTVTNTTFRNLTICNTSAEGVLIPEGLTVTGKLNNQNTKLSNAITLTGGYLIGPQYNGSLKINNATLYESVNILGSITKDAGILTIPANVSVSVSGNCALDRWYLADNSGIKVNSGGTFYVKGNFNAIGWDYQRRASLVVNGRMEVDGNFTLQDNLDYSNTGTLVLRGDVTLPYYLSNDHMVILDGAKAQTINAPKMQHVKITNSSSTGVTFNPACRVYGTLEASTGKVANGTNLYLDGGKLLGSVYNGDLTLAGEIRFTEDTQITGSVYLCNSVRKHSIAVVDGANLHVKQSVYLHAGKGRYGNEPVGTITSYFTVQNGSVLTVDRNLSVQGSTWYYMGENYHYMTYNNNGTAYIGGNVIISDYSRLGNSRTTVLTGSRNQIVTGLTEALTVIIDKTAGKVTFNNDISVTTLFDHKGNNFVLYNEGTGSNFVDYDGDGMKDNVDPQPTVGNPCTILISSQNAEQGSVSAGRIDTVGGTSVTVSATPMEHHIFTKWIDGSGNTVSTKQEYTFLATGSVELIAVFDRVCTVWEDSDGDGVLDYADRSVVYGTNYRLYKGYKRSDKTYRYEFLGWATSPDGEVVYAAEVTETAPITEDIQLYAKFRPVAITYTITFDAQGGAAVEKMTAGYNGSIQLPKTTREGYSLLGWTETTETDAIVLKAGASYTVTGNKKLYARWEEITLRGDVNLDGDVNAADLTKLARHVAEIEFISDTSALANAEVTGDGEITAADLTKMARYVAEIIIDWDQE